MCRAVIAVAALYALALQVVLGAAALAGTVGPDGGLVHILCAPDAGETNGASKPHPAHGHLPCCQAAHVLPSLDVPEPAHAVIVWPPKRIVRVAPRPEIGPLPRAPPGTRPSPRAPPVV
ncbi:hypothetical protein MPPM_1413 [Methylorubrum populi]|uniref:DUF2946 domain-containing protein n=1 Tax=Methylorubrum populi TaxID=223967 RepID=A0A161JLS6_9HYPH|nr:hypothetical protein [Methylorubrum populi]BAU90018.1 hypothetical protein MPPM_1413 [Methylorubrum populi]